MAFFIGLDLGGTNLKYALGDEDGKLIVKKKKPSRAKEKSDLILDNLVESVNELKSQQKTEIKAVGIGSPGCIDFEHGQIIGVAANLPEWSNAPIKNKLEEKINIPVFVDNDANLMALAEARLGAAKNYKNVVCLTIGTGIGGAIIVDGNLYRGATYSAAEIGHMSIEFNGRKCRCGNRGCLELYTAAPAMVERYVHKLKKNGLFYESQEISTKSIFEKARVHEDLAIETINEVCDYLGAGIANILNLVNPEIVVIGGGVANAGEVFIKRIASATKERALNANARKVKIVKAELGNDAGVIGSILLAAENSNQIRV